MSRATARVPWGGQPTVQALGGLACGSREPLEPDRRVHEFPQRRCGRWKSNSWSVNQAAGADAAQRSGSLTERSSPERNPTGGESGAFERPPTERARLAGVGRSTCALHGSGGHGCDADVLLSTSR